MISRKDNVQDVFTAAALLQENPEHIAWPERVKLVKRIAAMLAAKESPDSLLPILMLLAEDPKWEVRKEVADNLLLLPEDRIPRFAALLGEDTNFYVRSGIERALDRKRRGAETARKKRKSLEHVQSDYEEIERLHGAPAARKARRTAERLYDTLVGATVHDMRNMITPVKSVVSRTLRDLMAGMTCNPDEMETRLMTAQSQIEMIERMLDDMRAYSMPMPKERRPERLQGLIDEAIAMTQNALESADRFPDGVTLHADVDAGLTIVVARDRFVRAVMNIILNAYDAFAADRYNFREGEIQIVARAVDQHRVEIIIQDNGKGIKKDDLAQIRMFRPGGSSKRWGNGLGLPTSEKLIRAHGGSLTIDSVRGVGTMVTMTLPNDRE